MLLVAPCKRMQIGVHCGMHPFQSNSFFDKGEDGAGDGASKKSIWAFATKNIDIDININNEIIALCLNIALFCVKFQLHQQHY